MNTIALTVVMALTDHRHRSVRALEAWNRQTFGRERIRLHLLHDGSDDALAAELSSLLEPQDEVFRLSGKTETELYDAGVRRARTEWVFLTEPHVEVHEEAVAQMLDFVSRHALDGAACRSHGASDNTFIGRMEDSVFARDLAAKCRADHWNRIILRGCCLRRSVYIDCGGLVTRFGHFSEPLLGARLHARGYRIGIAERSVCVHYGVTRFRTLLRSLIEYGFLEMSCCSSLDSDFESRYFGLMNAYRRRSFVPARLARSLSRRYRRWRRRDSTPAATLLLEAQHRPMRRTAWRLRRAAIALAPMLLRIAPSIRIREAWAMRLWSEAIRLGRDSFLLHQPQSTHDFTPRGCLPASRLGAHDCLGFFDLERDRAGVFRWTGGAALALLPLPPGRSRVTLSMRPRPGIDQWICMSSVDARCEAPVAVLDSISITVKAGAADGPTPIFVLSSVFTPASGDTPDRRTLGVACTGFQWHALS